MRLIYFIKKLLGIASPSLAAFTGHRYEYDYFTGKRP
mgnify:CR=1 FL=1|jgi:hypothetical protein